MTIKQAPGPIQVFKANAAVAIHRIVKLAANGEVTQSTATAADAHIGVTDRPAPVGESVEVTVYGMATVEAGGAIARGAQIKADADGKAVTAAAGQRVVGIAIENAAAEGDLIAALIAPGTI